MKKPWIFTGNTFNSVTKGSHSKMLNISADSDDRLHSQISNPEIDAIYTDYHPVYVAYSDICLNYDIATGAREGETLNLETLMQVNMKEQIALWEGKVRSVYPQGSPQEKAYFPDGRTPFWSGSYTQRILRVKGLAEKLAADTSPVLTAYAPTVMSFYNTLKAARSVQVGDKTTVGTLSTTRENQRQLVAKALYTVLARLMYLFHSDSAQVANYFNLELIRKKSKDSFPATSLEIYGKVTVGDSTTPVVNCTIMLNDVDRSRVNFVKATAGFAITTSDDQGRYSFLFENLPLNETGFILMTINMPGFQPFEREIMVTTGERIEQNIQLAVAMMKAA